METIERATKSSFFAFYLQKVMSKIIFFNEMLTFVIF